MHAREIDFSVGELPSLQENVIARVASIRRHARFFWSTRQRCWLITRYADVQQAYRGQLPLAAKRFRGTAFEPWGGQNSQDPIPTFRRLIPRWMGNLDGDEHANMKRLVLQMLPRAVIESVVDRASARVHAALRRISKGDVVDFAGDFSRPTARFATAALIGADETALAALDDAKKKLVPAFNSFATPEELIAAERSLVAVCEALKASLRSGSCQPVSMLSTMAEYLDVLDEPQIDDLIANALALFIAGTDPLENALSFALLDLSRNADALGSLESVDNLALTEELLRIGPRFGATTRYVADDFELDGVRFRKGEFVKLIRCGANRDETVYARPDFFDPSRPKVRSLTFGPGLHACVGQQLARTSVMTLVAATASIGATPRIDETRTAYFEDMSGISRLVGNLSRSRNALHAAAGYGQ